MLEDCVTFQHSSLAPWKGGNNENLDPGKKDQSAKWSSLMLLALIFKSSMYVIKIVKFQKKETKFQKQKLCFLLYIPHLLWFQL